MENLDKFLSMSLEELEGASIGGGKSGMLTTLILNAAIESAAMDFIMRTFYSHLHPNEWQDAIKSNPTIVQQINKLASLLRNFYDAGSGIDSIE